MIGMWPRPGSLETSFCSSWLNTPERTIVSPWRTVTFVFTLRVRKPGTDAEPPTDTAREVSSSRDLGLDLRLDVAVAVRGGAQVEDDAVRLVLDGELVVGDERNRHLAAGEELGLLTAGAHQLGLGEQAAVAVVGLEADAKLRVARADAAGGAFEPKVPGKRSLVMVSAAPARCRRCPWGT